MTEKQIREWITDYLKKNPQVAEDYKKEHLANLQAKLKLSQLYFDGSKRESDAKNVVDLTKEIHENENKSATEVFTDNYTKEYISREKKLKENISFFKGFDEEDAYVYAVFREVGGYIMIYNKKDIDFCLENYRKSSYVHKIKAIYKKGLSKRDEHVKKGKKLIEDRIANDQLKLDNLQQDLIQELTDSEVNSKKQNCRELSQISVADAFKQLGTELTDRQSEKIERIVEMHDPKVVESVAKKLQEYPTENMIKLAKAISESPVRSRDDIKDAKRWDILEIAMGAVIGAFALVSATTGNLFGLINASLGALNVGTGIHYFTKHTRQIDKLDKKDSLVERCIDDFLGEVVMEETYNAGMTK